MNLKLVPTARAIYRATRGQLWFTYHPHTRTHTSASQSLKSRSVQTDSRAAGGTVVDCMHGPPRGAPSRGETGDNCSQCGNTGSPVDLVHDTTRW